MRPTCTHCALKHLSQASILLSESRQGYPTHIRYALGHMAEAGDELAKEYPDHALMVRAERKSLEDDPDYSPDYDALMDKIDEECSVCTLEPGPPLRPPGSASAPLGTARRNPSCQDEILSCAGTGKSLAECRASVSCPP